MKTLNYVKKIIFLLVLTVLSSSCNKKQSKSTQNGFQTFHIEFAKINIDLPDSYVVSSLDKMIENLTNFNFPYTDIENIKSMAASTSDVIYIVDSLDYSNFITFLGGSEHINITSDVARQYIEIFGDQLEKKFASNGEVNTERLDNRYFLGKYVQIIKLKNRLQFNTSQSYITQYIISSHKKTFTMVVNNLTGDDFEEQVKNIRLRK